jgi:hypothetical protein
VFDSRSTTFSHYRSFRSARAVASYASIATSRKRRRVFQKSSTVTSDRIQQPAHCRAHDIGERAAAGVEDIGAGQEAVSGERVGIAGALREESREAR